jgi:hypothetical protein
MRLLNAQIDQANQQQERMPDKLSGGAGSNRPKSTVLEWGHVFP